MTKSLIELIGNTPLLRLDEVSEASGCEIFGKAEFLNPGQSVKDRAALQIVRDAIDSGELKKGATIVEGTAGNTGIGLALVGAYFGFKVVIVIPDTQSQEKKDQIRLLGAHLIEVPPDPTEQIKPLTVPSVCSQISGPVVREWASLLAVLSN